MHASLAITVYFDLICPWCLIGRHHLRHALDRFSRSHPEAVVNVEWLSYPLLPEIPAAGLPYQSFYEQRLGGPEAVAARRAQVRQAWSSRSSAFASCPTRGLHTG